MPATPGGVPAAGPTVPQKGPRPTRTGSVVGGLAIVSAAKSALGFTSGYSQARPFPSSLAACATTPTDCSGFAILCYKQAGMPDPSGNGYDGQGFTGDMITNGTPTTNPLPGDLAFWSSPDHVAVYIGAGRIIEWGGPPGPIESSAQAENAYHASFDGYRHYAGTGRANTGASSSGFGGTRPTSQQDTGAGVADVLAAYDAERTAPRTAPVAWPGAFAWWVSSWRQLFAQENIPAAVGAAVADTGTTGTGGGSTAGGSQPGGSPSGGFMPCTLTWYDPALGGTNTAGAASPTAPTASGQPYSETGYTCAAPSQYAFGTVIQFRYGGRTVNCTVNDRGGAIVGSHFDLARAPATALGIIGPGVVQAQFAIVSKG